MKKILLIKLIWLSLILTNKQFAQIIRYDWAEAYGGANGDETKAIAVDKNGNIIITGTFEGTVDFDPSANISNLTSVGGADIFIAKYTKNNSLVWAYQIGNTGTSEVWDLKIDNSNNILLGGNFSNTCDFDLKTSTSNLISYGATDGFIAKYDENATLIFAKQIGGGDIDRVNRIAVNEFNEIAIAGYFKDSAYISPGSIALKVHAPGNDIDGFLSYLDSNGNIKWGLNIGATGNDQCVGVGFVNRDPVITGYTQYSVNLNPLGITPVLFNFGSDAGAFINRYKSADGTLIWGNGNTSSGNPLAAFDLEADKNGNIYVTGYKNGLSYFNGIQTSINYGSSDAFLLKLDSNGNQVFNHIIGANAADAGWSISLSPTHDTVAVSGQYYGVGKFNPANQSQTLNSNLKDGFTALYKSNGDYLDALAIGGGGTSANDNTWANAIGNGKLYIGGNLQASADFDPSTNSAVKSAIGISDGYLASYTIECTPAQTPSIFLSSDTVCLNSQVQINLSGSLNMDTNWAVRNGNCGGSIVNYGSTINLNSFPSVGTYTYYANGVGCNDTSSCAIITIEAVVKNLSINQNIDTLFADNRSAYTYQWIDCNNSNAVIPGANNYYYVPSTIGSYAVVIEGYNCIDTTACYIYNGTTGISSQANLNFKVYPNPTTNQLFIEGENIANKTIEILTIDGKTVLAQQTLKNQIAIDLSSLSKGTYLIKIGNQFSRVIKE